MCCRLATKIVKAQNAVQQLGGNTAAKVRRQQNDLELIHSAQCTFALAEVLRCKHELCCLSLILLMTYVQRYLSYSSCADIITAHRVLEGVFFGIVNAK